MPDLADPTTTAAGRTAGPSRLHRIEAVGRSVKSFHGLFEMLASLSLLRGEPAVRA